MASTSEESRKRVDALRNHLAEGAEQAKRGEFVDTFTVADVMRRAKGRARK